MDEPTREETVDILRGLADRYETHHTCVYPAEVLQAAVDLAIRYLPDRRLPDKAIDIIDEAGSRVRINSYTRRKYGET